MSRPIGRRSDDISRLAGVSVVVSSADVEVVVKAAERMGRLEVGIQAVAVMTTTRRRGRVREGDMMLWCRVRHQMVRMLIEMSWSSWW